MPEIAVRAYIMARKNRKSKRSGTSDEQPSFDRIFAFDTETTVDKAQALKFGSFVVYFGDDIERIGLFYDPDYITQKELRVLKDYQSKHKLISLHTRDDFIENIFYYYVYEQRVPCIGFNLPFDLSRLSFGHVCSRKKRKGGFTLKLSMDEAHPPMMIEHLGSHERIKFWATRYNKFRGCFVETQNLSAVLTNRKHMSLAEACKLFNKKHFKLDVESHGAVTPQYIKYNIEDTLCTAELFRNLYIELGRYGLDIRPEEVFSAASIGKRYLRTLGITRTIFPDAINGILMQTYYGGHCECLMRKVPVKVSVLDFTSMYPTVSILLDLWEFLIAEKIDVLDDTKNVKRFIERVTLEDLKDAKTWLELNVIVQIEPDDDLLPVRARYDGETFNVGLNYLSSTKKIWYTLADAVRSKLSTGRVPKVSEAIRFVPIGRSKTLHSCTALGIKIDPNKDNLFKVLVNERQRIKKTDKDRANAIKIVVNAASYGIFVETNVDGDDGEVLVCSGTEFKCIGKIERNGSFFNPLLASMITGGARLMLGMAESILKKHGESYVYCDTDSVFTPPKRAKELQNFFKSLSPYAEGVELLKNEAVDMWFYGLSSKRYVLYKLKRGKIIINESAMDEDYSLHGLGHLLNPFGSRSGHWQKVIWEDFLKLEYSKTTMGELIDKYRNFYCVSEFSVTSKPLLDRFRVYNDGKSYKEQIKPFNFMLIGIGNTKDIKPIAPFDKDTQSIAFGEFVDYKTGRVMEGQEYFKNLADELLHYLNHHDAKLEGDVGLLKRRHITADRLIYIGKETNRVEENMSGLEAPTVHTYHSKNELRKKIQDLTLKDAKALGIPNRTFYRLRKAVKDGKNVRVRRKTKTKINA